MITSTPGQELPSVTIDGQTYLIDSLSNKGKQLVSAMAALQAYDTALKEEVGQ